MKRKTRIFPFLILLLITVVHAAATKPKRVYPELPCEVSGIELIAIPDVKCTYKAVEIRASAKTPRSTDKSGTISYGVIFAMEDSANYCCATLQAVNDGDDDGIRDGRYMLLTVTRNTSRESIQFASKRLNSGIDLDCFDNTLAIEINCSTGSATIFVGKTTIQPVLTINLTPDETQGAIGFKASSKTNIELVVGEYIADPIALLGIPYTKTIIENKMGSDKSPVLGYWQYLDRNTDADYMRPGGKYSLAIIPTDNTERFDIVYLDGADVNGNKWEYGMIKGILETTPFKDHFNLIWFDAEMNPISDECSATLESKSILRLDFPLLKSSVRFSRQP